MSRCVGNSEYQIQFIHFAGVRPKTESRYVKYPKPPSPRGAEPSSRSLIPKLGLFPKARGGLRRLWWMRKSSVAFRDSHSLSKYWCCMCFRAQDSHSPSPRKRPGVCVPRESTAPSSVLVLRGLYLHIPGGSHTFSVKGAPWSCGGLARAAQFLYVPQWLSGGLEGKD